MPPRPLPRWALLGIGRRHRLRQGDGEIHGKGGPLPQMALHGDGAAHGVDETLDDGEPQAGALIDAAGVVFLLGKGLENALLELLAHAHAGVPDGEAEMALPRPRRELLHDEGDLPASGGVFGRIGQEVQKDLAEPQPGHQDAVGPVVQAALEAQAAAVHQRADDHFDGIGELRPGERLRRKGQAAALDLAHVQNIVDEPQEEVAGSVALVQIAADGAQTAPWPTGSGG